MAITVAARKAKGRNLQNYVGAKLAEKYGLEFGKDEDLQGREMGQSGTDIRMSKDAKRVIPFDIECKNQERLNFWEAIEQAEKNTEEGRIPLLVFKRNRSKTYAIIEFETLLKII